MSDTPKCDDLVRKLEAEVRAMRSSGAPMEEPLSQALTILADTEKEVAAWKIAATAMERQRDASRKENIRLIGILERNGLRADP